MCRGNNWIMPDDRLGLNGQMPLCNWETDVFVPGLRGLLNWFCPLMVLTVDTMLVVKYINIAYVNISSFKKKPYLCKLN